MSQKAKDIRIAALRQSLTGDQSTFEGIGDLCAKFSVASVTIAKDIALLLKSKSITVENLVHHKLLRSSSIRALASVPISRTSDAVQRRNWLRTAATLLMNHYYSRNESCTEKEAFFESALISVIQDVSRDKGAASNQLVMPFAAIAPCKTTERTGGAKNSAVYLVCEDVRCLRIRLQEDDSPPCPKRHGAPVLVEGCDSAVGRVGELLFLRYLKEAARRGILSRIEHIDQRHAVRGSDPTTRKRPDYIVWNLSGEEFWIDVKTMKKQDSGRFILYRSQAQVMSYWKNPVVVFFERIDQLTVDRSIFYSMNSKILTVILNKKNYGAVLPVRIADLEQNQIVFHDPEQDAGSSSS
jgi:hypothetical protein